MDSSPLGWSPQDYGCCEGKSGVTRLTEPWAPGHRVSTQIDHGVLPQDLASGPFKLCLHGLSGSTQGHQDSGMEPLP